VSDSSSQKLNRRALLLGAVLLVGGGAALTRFVRKPGAASAAGPALTAAQFALLEQVCETIIPTTDTAGAIVAGVPVFIRQMIEEWSSAESRAELIGVLDTAEKQAWSRFGAAFVELAPERRFDVINDLDVQRLASQDPAYRKFKHLVLLGYYHSEVGATHELRFELVPGAWRSCVPLSEIGRASAV
jgi:glucoside 3-dehydrogenase (cytochrome c) hitch-hiker subunit